MVDIGAAAFSLLFMGSPAFLARQRALLRAPVVGTPIASLAPRAFAISVAQMVTIYHSLYVALAEQRDIPLVTADEKLMQRLSGDAALRRRMMWVGDLAAW